MPGRPGDLRSSLRRADFHRTTRHGRRVVTDYFLVFLLDRPDGGEARLGITVTRKVGKAVRRNRIRRLVREWFRHRQREFESCDLVVIAKRGIPDGLGFEQVCRDLDRLLGGAGGRGDSSSD